MIQKFFYFTLRHGETDEQKMAIHLLSSRLHIFVLQTKTIFGILYMLEKKVNRSKLYGEERKFSHFYNFSKYICLIFLNLISGYITRV